MRLGTDVTSVLRSMTAKDSYGDMTLLTDQCAQSPIDSPTLCRMRPHAYRYTKTAAQKSTGGSTTSTHTQARCRRRRCALVRFSQVVCDRVRIRAWAQGPPDVDHCNLAMRAASASQGGVRIVDGGRPHHAAQRPPLPPPLHGPAGFTVSGWHRQCVTVLSLLPGMPWRAGHRRRSTCRRSRQRRRNSA